VEDTVMLHLMIEYANSAADRWAAWILAASLDAAVLLAMAGLVWLAIRNRVAPQVGYCLFLLVPLKLLVPVVVTVPAPMAKWTPSVLISSCFERPREPERGEGRPPVETQVAAAGPVRPAPPGSRPEPVAADSHQPALPAEPRAARPARLAADLPARPIAEAPALSMPAGFLIAWLIGVLLLLGRLVATQLRFRGHLRRMAPLDESELAVDVRALCRRAGVSETIRIVEDDAAAVPAVWGIIRPTIILPRGIASVLTAEQLRWVLLHELAHVRRHDLIVLTLQRIAAILHFFNPAIWVADRIIDHLREYACDDLAVSLSDASGVESGEAFVRILEYADRGRRGPEGALGIFGLDARAALFLRVRRLLETEGPIRTAPGGWSLWGLILLAIVSVPHLRAAGEAPPAGSQAPAGEVPAKTGQEFELLVVGPGGKPIPGAVVELRADPSPTAGQVRKGKLVRRDRYEALVATDGEGRLVVELPRAPDWFDVFIRIPGYGPYWAGWSSDRRTQPIPTRLTAELEAAWSVGGIVVDADGKPVQGATIQPRIEFKKRPGETQEMAGGGSVKTDAAGKWRFDSVPVSRGEVFVEIDHPSFRPARRPLTRGEFGLEPGRGPAARIALDRGLTVTGKVTDEGGKPIAGALVRTKFLNDIREATTGPDGVYKLVGCEPKTTRIVVSAKGRATDVRDLTIEPDMGPVDFRMKPGGTVRVRVLDERGNPVPRARIFFQGWRGDRFRYFEFDHVGQFADKDGVWAWHEAPLDEFKADICSPDGPQLSRQPLIARAEEYVFRLPSKRIEPDRVGDAATKPLAKGEKSISAKVVTPRNIPAAGAKVALGVAGSQININNGEIDDGLTFSKRAEADASGRFSFPAQKGNFQLMIVHPSGFAYIKSTPDWDLTRIIHLEPWSRVEGTFRVGKAPVANAPIRLEAADVNSFGPDVPSVFNHHEVTTGPGGRFLLDRVIPGRGRIGRNIVLTVEDGAAEVTSACTVAADFPAGKTVHIDLGGIGRPVVGKLRPPEGFGGKVRWNFALVQVEPVRAAPRPDAPSFMATVDRDGSFRIDDVPAGDYSLSVRFDRDAVGQLFNHRFHVPSPEGAGTGRPVDLGTLKLEKP
jgi:beta-lactamase regulating signal transducer with metallopeptidase domain/protocatechuate 3,4-dioxygenase beta subunit